jgi:glycosyltransferase involved in cell wall biosynthesis
MPENLKSPSITEPVILSVLMPCFNAVKTISKAVLSTLRAMPENSELLVMLDGCTDGTAAQLEKIVDRRLKVYNSEINLGVAKATNDLLSKSSSRYIARMDADDVCFPNRFISQIKTMNSENLDFLFGNVVLFGSGIPLGLAIPQLPTKISSEEATLALVIACPFIHSTMIGRRTSLLELQGYRPLPAEDYDLWIRAATASMKLAKSRNYVVGRRIHAGQVMNNPQWQLDLSNQQNGIALQLVNLAKIKLGIDIAVNTPIEKLASDVWESSKAAIKVSWLKKFKYFGLKRALLPSKFGHY